MQCSAVRLTFCTSFYTQIYTGGQSRLAPLPAMLGLCAWVDYLEEYLQGDLRVVGLARTDAGCAVGIADRVG